MRRIIIWRDKCNRLIAFTEFGDRFEEHPYAHIKIGGCIIEIAPQIVETARKFTEYATT